MFKPNKGISTPVGIIIIVLCALLAGGILAYQYWWAPKYEVPSIKISPKPEKKIETTIANWKTYRNEEYGFEIKHPRLWYEYGTLAGVIQFSTLSPEESVGEKYSEIYREGSYGKIIITYIKESQITKHKDKYGEEDPLRAILKNAEEFTKEIEQGPYIDIKELTTEEIKIGGISGNKMYYILEESPIKRETVNIIYWILDKNSRGALGFYTVFFGENKGKYLEDFDQMLSTFRFLE